MAFIDDTLHANVLLIFCGARVQILCNWVKSGLHALKPISGGHGGPRFLCLYFKSASKGLKISSSKSELNSCST